MALAEPAAEGAAGDEAAPALADQRGAEEARWVAGREAEEDLLLDELLHERRHGALLLLSWPERV